jgi:hypothetical protein
MRLIPIPLLVILLVAAIPGHTRAAETCLPNQPAEVACLDNTFTSFWQANGGLPVFGYAIAPAGPERNADAPQEFVAQWTERNRFELHPENRAPYQILLGRMGAERLAQLGRDSAAEGRENGPIAGCLWFETTGHNVCNQDAGQGFASYWQSHGLKIGGLDAYSRSLALFGLPLTAARQEQSANGQTLLTQWFERARFEWHPDNPGDQRVLLGLLGAELRAGQNQTPAAASIFGVTISRGFAGATYGRASAARANWVRYGDFMWSEIEPTPGAREWTRLAGMEEEIKALANQGLTTIAVVRSTPAWAQQIPGHTCGAIKPEALEAFAVFMRDLVARYSAPPYNILHWEIWNEEDVDPSKVAPDSGYGCWGDAADPYYGGGAYAEMLKRIYPAIKQANSGAKVVLGGLLLDCDAEHPIAGRDCAESRFLEGVLRNGGGAAFDIMSYHGYAFWTGKNEDWDMNPSWQARGGAVRGKLQLIRETLARYQADKPVLLTEAGLLCYQADPRCIPRFFSAQASYLPRVYARAWSSGLLGAIWYTLEGPGWERGGLLDENQQPRPAYQAFSFMAGLLQGASYAGPRSNGSIEGYAFRKGATSYELYWVNNDTPARMAWPAGTVAAYDLLGQPLAVVGSDLEVNFNPIFIEIRS